MELRKLNSETVDFTKLKSEQLEPLVPAIVVDGARLAIDGLAAVLMVGFMNQASLDATMLSGNVTFFSRARQELWEKGATSGNTLKVRDIFIDCDRDSLLIDAEPLGPTCCNGEDSCFMEKPPKA